MMRFCYNCELEVEVLEDKISNAGLCPICNTVILRSSSKLPPGTQLGGFEIIEEIGRGGMGIVYKAKQLNLERLVALKVLADDLASDEEFVSNFFKEARAAASLNHPNIVQVYDAGISSEGIYYFAMELILGETVEEYLDNNIKFDTEEAIKISIKVAKALDYAWRAKQLTHGDIKPDNIILDSDSCAKLADLGLAKCMHDDFTEGHIMATPLYAPPEIIKGEYDKIGSQSDMYSFGITLFQMIAGATPFPNDSPDAVIQMQLNQIPTSLINYNQRLHPNLVELVQKLLAKAPEDRPKDWNEVCSILEALEYPEIDIDTPSEHHQVFKVKNAHKGQVDASTTIKKPRKRIKTILTLIIVIPLLVITGLMLLNPDKKLADITKDLTKGLIKDLTDDEIKDLTSDEIEIDSEQIDLPPPTQVPPQKQFKELKKEISSLPLNKKIQKIQEFIKKAPSPPKEAQEELKTLQASLKALQDKKKKEKFSIAMHKITDFTSKLPKDDFSLITKAKKYKNQIPNLLNKLDKKDYLSSCPQWKKALQKSDKILHNYLTSYQKFQLKQEALKRKELQQLKLATKKIDAYYKLLNDYTLNKKLRGLKKSITQWLENSQDAPEEFSLKVKFLSTNINELPKIYNYIFKYHHPLKNKSIPAKACPSKLRNYQIQQVTKMGLVLFQDTGKVITKKKLKWKQLSSQQLSIIMLEKYLKKSTKITKLPEKGFNVFILYILLQQPKLLQKYFSSIKFSNPTNKKMWTQIIKDLEQSKSETKKILTLETIFKNLQYDNYYEAIERFSNLMKSYTPNSSNNKYDFFERHQASLEKIKNIMIAMSAENSAKTQYKQLINNQNPLFEEVILLEAKYYNVFDKEEQDIIHKIKLKALSTIGKKAKQSIDDPFYVSQPTYKTYYKLLKKKLNKSKTENINTFISALYFGDWNTAKKTYITTRDISAPQIYKNPPIAKWAGPLVFARGIIALQEGDTLMAKSAMKDFTNLNKINARPELKASNIALSMEYALMCGNPDIAIKIGKSYKYSNKLKSTIQTKIVLLSVLSLVYSPIVKNKRIKDIYNILRKKVKINQFDYKDKRWIEIAINIIDGNCTARDIKELAETNCLYSDIAQRLIITATARYYLNGGKLDDKLEKRLLNLLFFKLGHNFYNSETWKTYFLFKLSLSKTYTQFNKNILEAFYGNNLASIRFYPALVILKNGCNYRDKLFGKEKAIENIKEYGTASLLVSKNFTNYTNAASNAKLNIIKEKISKEKMYYQGYICVILNSMLYYEKSNIYNQVLNNVKSAPMHFSWEEKLFLKNLNSILFNNDN